ncbi:MAG: TonB-dependent receptor plug domain-containing protein, partial [Veillonella sp.]|nr:TonB-dependent receptor plug domain-containing protein [Veillonella sp.]
MSQSMKRVAMATLAALAATTSWSAVQAAEANEAVVKTQLAPIVITGTRVEESVEQVPAQMYVVTGKELENRHVTNMSEALRNVPGVYQQVSGTGYGYESSNAIRIRGTKNVQYLVDGMSMVMPTASSYVIPTVGFQNIDSIGQVEVLEGAASSLYGSDAVGGVINVITAKPKEGVKTKVRLMGGSYNQEQYGVMNEGRQDNLYWRASYVKNHMGDFRDAEGNNFAQSNQSHTASFMIGDEIDANNDVRLNFDTYRANVKYGNYLGSSTVRNGHRSYDSYRAIWNNKINDNLKHSFHVGRNEYKTSRDYTFATRHIMVGDKVTYENIY